MMEYNFCGKFIFAQIWAKKAQNRVLCVLWKYCHFFFLKQYKMKIILILYFLLQALCLANFLFWSYRPNILDQSGCRIFQSVICRKYWGIKLISGLQVNIRVSYKLLLSFLVGVARHSQSTQNNKFVISL